MITDNSRAANDNRADSTAKIRTIQNKCIWGLRGQPTPWQCLFLRLSEDILTSAHTFKGFAWGLRPGFRVQVRMRCRSRHQATQHITSMSVLTTIVLEGVCGFAVYMCLSSRVCIHSVYRVFVCADLDMYTQYVCVWGRCAPVCGCSLRGGSTGLMCSGRPVNWWDSLWFDWGKCSETMREESDHWLTDTFTYSFDVLVLYFHFITLYCTTT